MAEADNSQTNPIIRIEVGNLQETEFEELDLPVDPEALHTILPGDVLKRLEVPVKKTLERLAQDGSRVPEQIGDAVIRIGNVQIYDSVIFGDDDVPTRIGDLTLKLAFLQLNPETHELEPIVLRERRRFTT